MTYIYEYSTIIPYIIVCVSVEKLIKKKKLFDLEQIEANALINATNTR